MLNSPPRDANASPVSSTTTATTTEKAGVDQVASAIGSEAQRRQPVETSAAARYSPVSVEKTKAIPAAAPAAIAQIRRDVRQKSSTAMKHQTSNGQRMTVSEGTSR